MLIRVISLENWGATTEVIGMIRDIVAEKDVNTEIEIITVRTREDAIKYRHIGGPTVQVNGLDIEPEARTIEQFGITWRRYGLSSIPPRELLESAIDEAEE